jgi:hypothetical protein
MDAAAAAGQDASSPEAMLATHLIHTLDLPADDASRYVEALVASGCTTEQRFGQLSAEQLQELGFKKGHALKATLKTTPKPEPSSTRTPSIDLADYERQLETMSKVDVARLAKTLKLDEETVLDEAEDVDEPHAFLTGHILDKLQSLSALKFGPLKRGAKQEFNLSAEQIEAVTDDSENKKGAVLRLIFDQALVQAGVVLATPDEEGEPVGLTLEDGSTLELSDEVLGRGGGGVVRGATLTRRSGSTEQVAVKMLPPGASEQEHQQFVKEFKLNLQASQRCGGVGICQVYDFVKQGADMCIVMKRYERSLEDLLQEQTALPQDQVLVLALHIARALAGLHAAEIRVQDLKPANILLDKEGMPHISDFGVAAIEGATQTKSSFGTPTYMCPGETSLGVLKPLP